MNRPVSIIMGSKSDLSTVSHTVDLLKEYRVGFEIRVLSAHRTPRELSKYVEGGPQRGIKVFIAAAGGAAALAGVIASHTTLPVIGIPIETRGIKGLDSLLSTVQMPAGIPVGCVAIGKAGAKNAAILALEILGINDRKIASRLKQKRRRAAFKIKRTKIKI